MCTAIAAALEVDEAKDIRDRAMALACYARQAQNRDAERRAMEIRVRAERRAGELLEAMPKAKGAADGSPGPGRGNKTLSDGSTAFSEQPTTLPELGITCDQSSEWQRLAAVPEDYFEEGLAAAEMPSGRLIIARAQGVYRTNFNVGCNEWFTPEKYIELARAVMGDIDLDPASHPIAQKTVRATQFFTEADDGLTQDWAGRVFCNPPFSNGLMAPFVDKLLSEIANGNVREAILLTHNHSDTRWFHAILGAVQRVCFTVGRVDFRSPLGDIASPVQGQCFHYFGENVERFEEVFSTIGKIVVPLDGERP